MRAAVPPLLPLADKKPAAADCQGSAAVREERAVTVARLAAKFLQTEDSGTKRKKQKRGKFAPPGRTAPRVEETPYSNTVFPLQANYPTSALSFDPFLSFSSYSPIPAK